MHAGDAAYLHCVHRMKRCMPKVYAKPIFPDVSNGWCSAEDGYPISHDCGPRLRLRADST